MEPVDILAGIDRGDDRLFVELARERQLDEDPVNRRVLIEPLDQREQRRLAGIGRQAVFEAGDARRLAGLALGADIDLARRILADQHHSEARTPAGMMRKRRRARSDPRAQALGKSLAVDERCLRH